MTRKPPDSTWPHPQTEPEEERASHSARRHVEEAWQRAERAEGERAGAPETTLPEDVWDTQEAIERLEEAPSDLTPAEAQDVMMDTHVHPHKRREEKEAEEAGRSK